MNIDAFISVGINELSLEPLNTPQRRAHDIRHSANSTVSISAPKTPYSGLQNHLQHSSDLASASV